ncbi:MAG: baseplate J/gp47 family protein [Alphaproteobacteria bacterium]|nr:baseplate J/gp47 family protein [Alphaproteobacteria bacterium]
MPWSRKTLSQLRAESAADVTTNVQGADGFLRFAVLRILADILAGHANDQYGYLDYIAKQSVPWTATDENLQGWASLKNVYLKDATAATGTVSFPGTAGTITAGSGVTRSDNVAYTVKADATVSGSSVTVTLTANNAGAAGNADIGTSFTLDQAVSGIQSTGTAATAFTGGADVETQDSFYARTMYAYQNPPQGGAETDYVQWATAVSGVTRAWCIRNGNGIGTVVVYIMLDNAESSHQGFPQGTNGVAASETRDTVATGDQLTVANYIWGPERQPVTALVYVVAPIANTVNFTISEISGASSTMQTEIVSAIAGVFQLNGSPRGALDNPVDLSDIESAIAAIAGTEGFVISSVTCTNGTITPGSNGNIASNTGYLPVLGTVTYA